MRNSVRLALAAIASAVLLTSCGGADDPTSGASAGSDTAVEQDGGGGDSNAEAAADEDSARGADPATAARVIPGEREIVYTAEITVRVDEVDAASGAAERLVAAAQGVVSGEETTTDPDAPGNSITRLTMRVPPAEFRGLLEDLAALGERLGQTQSASDVTSQVVDTESRLASQRASVARVRALLERAVSIAEIVAVEAELAEREAELESLEAQVAALSDQTSLSTVTATLIGPTAEREPEEELGFLAGLRNGWDAFLGAIVVGLTVLGALLPFVLALLLLGVPLLLVLRARGRRAIRPTAVAATATPPN